MAGAPLGNQNAAKSKRMLTDALKRELVQNPEEALKVARKTIDAAIAGEPWAQSLIYERVDGKVPQAIVGDDDHDPISIKELVIRAIDATNSRPTEESQ